MPGAVAQTSTWALTNATIGYAVKIADRGVAAAVNEDAARGLGVNTYGGAITRELVATAHGRPTARSRRCSRADAAARSA